LRGVPFAMMLQASLQRGRRCRDPAHSATVDASSTAAAAPRLPLAPEPSMDSSFVPALAPREREARAVLPGLILAICTLLFGFGLGVVFGLNEDAIKSRLAASASAVSVTVYQGDAAASKAVLDKSWTYMQRAHLHAGGLGATAISLILVVVLLGVAPFPARLTASALGLGSLGYSVFWLWAGFRAPGLGGTGAAKESLAWLAIPASGLVVAATLAVAVFTVRALMRGPRG
jgi:hypothetical protein